MNRGVVAVGDVRDDKVLKWGWRKNLEKVCVVIREWACGKTKISFRSLFLKADRKEIW